VTERDWHDVGALDELRGAGGVVVRIGGREIGVLADPVTGDVHAVRNRCPHHGAPLCRGTLRTRLEGAPGGYALGDRRVLACPWHGWEFDLASGRCIDDARMRVATYPVRVDDGRVLVQA
jgi:nitrite reductase/ring-hydroxylating ferredoxin subunit